MQLGMIGLGRMGANMVGHADPIDETVAPREQPAPLRDPWAHRYGVDLAEVAEVWRRGSVVAFRLLSAMRSDFGGHGAKEGA